MRRAIQMFQTSDGVFHPTIASGGTQVRWSVKEKAALIDGFNTLQQLMVGSFDVVQPGEVAFSFPDGGAGPLIDVPGRLIGVGSNSLTGVFGCSFAFPELFNQEFDYDSLDNGDGADNAEQRARAQPHGTKGGAGTVNISLKSYLLLLLNTWQTVKPFAPQRWIEWLTLLINHYSRYTPTQIYGFLGRVDFSRATFRV